jgi:hypothetical protein
MLAGLSARNRKLMRAKNLEIFLAAEVSIIGSIELGRPCW